MKFHTSFVPLAASAAAKSDLATLRFVLSIIKILLYLAKSALLELIYMLIYLILKGGESLYGYRK